MANVQTTMYLFMLDPTHDQDPSAERLLPYDDFTISFDVRTQAKFYEFVITCHPASSPTPLYSDA
jgi:hypothetical protein